MAGQAVLFDRGMLPHEWAPLFRVARITKFIDGVCLYHFLSEPAVNIVAIGT
jgi:hypothetical protein